MFLSFWNLQKGPFLDFEIKGSTFLKFYFDKIELIKMKRRIGKQRRRYQNRDRKRRRRRLDEIA